MTALKKIINVNSMKSGRVGEEEGRGRVGGQEKHLSQGGFEL